MDCQMDKATLLPVVILLFLHPAESDVVSLTMKMQTEGSKFLYIHFDNGTFSVFYDCLSSIIWQECSATFVSDSPATNQNNDLHVNSVETDNFISKAGSAYFRCHNDLQKQHLLCTRQPRNTTECGAPKPSQVSTFQLNDKSSDPRTCVGIIWASSGEGIIFRNSELFDTCDPACTGNSSTDTLSDKGKTRNRVSSTKTEIIIAITITLAVLLGVVVVAVICWRQSLKSTRKDMGGGLDRQMCTASAGSSTQAEHELALHKDSLDMSV